MKALLFSLLVAFCCTNLFSQTASTITVKAGQNIMDALTMEDVFYYPQFKHGKVFFMDGLTAEGKMNYNRLLDEMHFIGPKGDTLALANEKTIKFIAVDNDSFYYHEGYLRRTYGNGRMKLAVNQVWKFADKKKAGAYNTSSSISSISSRSSYLAGGRFHNITVKEDLSLSKTEQYYFGDRFNHFILANKKNLLTFFPNQHKQIDKYLKENKVDFDNKNDLEKMIQFLEQL